MAHFLQLATRWQQLAAMQILLQVNFARMFDLARSTYSMILEERDITNLFPHIREISQMLELISGV
jgi:hypothetical protein